MAEGVTVERTVRAPPDLVWALACDTNRYDRALGLGPPRYRWQDVEGQRRLVGQAAQSGVSMSWIELPYEWVEGRFLAGRRQFLSGPALDGGLRVEVHAHPDGSLVRVTASGEARWWGLRVLSPVVRAGLRRRLAAYVDDLARVLEDEDRRERIAGPASGRTAVERARLLLQQGDAGALDGTCTPPDRAQLQRRSARLESAPVDPQASRRLIETLAQRPDDEVAQMRPFELARAWGLDRRAVLRTFLHGTRAGLVDLQWQINCPVCQVATAVVGQLVDVDKRVHCDTCNVRYDVDFGAHVEAVFRCSKALRPVDPAVYCASSPTFRPHVLAQLALAPGVERRETMELRGGSVRVRTLEEPLVADLDGAAIPACLRIVVDDAHIELSAEGASDDGMTDVVLTSRSDRDVYVIVERTGWAADAVLGSLVASMPDFVDLFATEAPAAGLELTVGTLTLLFSDLTGSTALYERIGDAKAYAVVQEHFRIVERAVIQGEGAIVKTMGDAVMATFAAPGAAIAAAIRVVEETEARHASLGIGVKLGVHEGACLAVRANDRLDFFGTTVNVAARLQGQARTGELVLAAELAALPEVAALLQDRPRRRWSAALKGIADAQDLVAFDLRGAAVRDAIVMDG